MSEAAQKRDRSYFAQKQKEYRERNKRKTRKACREYYENNREAIIARKIEYRRQRMSEDPLYREKIRVYELFKRQTWNPKLRSAIGCTRSQLKKHLLQTAVTRYGDKYSKIKKLELDHIKPLSSAKTEDDLWKLWHYTNLQYLTPVDNRVKGSKYFEE